MTVREKGLLPGAKWSASGAAKAPTPDLTDEISFFFCNTFESVKFYNYCQTR